MPSTLSCQMSTQLMVPASPHARLLLWKSLPRHAPDMKAHKLPTLQNYRGLIFLETRDADHAEDTRSESLKLRMHLQTAFASASEKPPPNWPVIC